MKKRTLTISLIVLAIMLLVGIGYAGWVITRSDSGAATGNFTAYSVEDNGAIDVSVFDGNIVFGKNGSDIDDAWLTAGDDVQAQDLEATFTVKWSGGAQSFNLTHSFNKEVSALLIGGPSIELVGTPTGVSVVNNVLSFTTDYVAYNEITIKVTYRFGSIFNNQNPYQFFNDKLVNDAAFTSETYNGNNSLSLSQINAVLTNDLAANARYADVANSALTELYALTSGLQATVAVQKVQNNG